jgi:RimJ/RimL family protein N-acetyltransferase
MISWKWRNDPELWKLTGSRPNREITPEIELDWIRKVLNESDSRRFAVLVEKDGEERYVGNVQLLKINGGTAEKHTFIGERSCWGCGVATEAGRLALRFAFQELGLKLVRAKIRSANAAMIRANEKIGFRQVGDEYRTADSGEQTHWTLLEASPESFAETCRAKC